MGLLNWGILTAGNISYQFATAFSCLPTDQHKLVGVAARDHTKASDFALEFGIKAFSSYHELVLDPVIDVVYIGAINTRHLPLAKMALENGKHVLCEKPLCLNVQETKELIEVARRTSRFLMEAIWSRFFPSFQRLREEIQRGSIGEIVEIFSTFGVDYAKKNRKMSRELGGGGILDIGVYNVQMALFVFPGLELPQIVSTGTLTSDGADESNRTVLTFENGRMATLVTDTTEDLSNEVVVIGTKGKMTVVRPFWRATSLNLGNGWFVEFLQPMDKEGKFNKSMGLSYQCHEVKRCIDEGKIESTRMSHSDSIRIAEIMEEMLKQMGVSYEGIVKFPATCRELFFSREITGNENFTEAEDRQILNISQKPWKMLVTELGLDTDSIKPLLELMNIDWIKKKVVGKFPNTVKIPFLSLAVYEETETHAAKLFVTRDHRKNQSATMMDISGTILVAVDSELLPYMTPGTAVALQNIRLLTAPNNKYAALALKMKDVIALSFIQNHDVICHRLKTFSPDQIKKDYETMCSTITERVPSDNAGSFSTTTDDENVDCLNAIELTESAVFSDSEDN